MLTAPADFLRSTGYPELSTQSTASIKASNLAFKLGLVRCKFALFKDHAESLTCHGHGWQCPMPCPAMQMSRAGLMDSTAKQALLQFRELVIESSLVRKQALQYLSTQPHYTVLSVRYFRRAYRTPNCLSTCFALLFSHMHTDPDSSPSFADKGTGHRIYSPKKTSPRANQYLHRQSVELVDNFTAAFPASSGVRWLAQCRNGQQVSQYVHSNFT